MSLNTSLRRIRHALGLVFDDDLGTRQWYNIADWVIVFMIMLSSVEIFISTFNVSPSTLKVLELINTVTLWFFVVEVSLRIWAAPELDPKFKGLRGRLRYCCTFYGFIDIVSTYPFLLQFFMPLSVQALKVLRTARIIRVLRITRYAKSFDHLFAAIRDKRYELIVSLQFLLIITFILSLILHIYEHEAQPDVYDNGFSSAVWAFAQYIGDPGQFADTPPVTIPGKIIACIVGVLGIAIFAVPAGILGSGFTETIEKEARREQLRENSRKLHMAFERKLDRPTGIQTVPFFRTLADIQARMHMTCDEMIEATESTPGFRLINLASTIPTERIPHDRLAIEHFYLNRPYGTLIDRGSRITIVSPSSMIDATAGIFSYYLAKIGGFNYISRELGETTPYKSYYTLASSDPEQEDYAADLRRLMSRPGAWSFTILVASGANEPDYPTQMHFGVGAPKGDETLDSPDLIINHRDTYRQLFEQCSEALQRDYGITSDNGRYHSTATPSLWPRKMGLIPTTDNVVIRIAWSVMLWSGNRLAVAKTLAEIIHRVILHDQLPAYDSELKTKDIGFNGYSHPTIHTPAQ